MQTAAIAKVQRMAEGQARYNGEIWSESARTLASTATFTVTRSHGEITGIWGVQFARFPRIHPGTEATRRQLQAA